MIVRAAKSIVLLATVISLGLLVTSIVLTRRLEAAGFESSFGSIRLQEWGVLINAYPHVDNDLKPVKSRWFVEEETQYRPRAQWLPQYWKFPDPYSNMRWFQGWSVFIPLWMPFILGLVLAIATLVPRRRIPGHLCSRCGYDLTGNTSGICPECGVSASMGARKARLAIRWSAIARCLIVATCLIAAVAAGALWASSYARSMRSIRTRQYPAIGWRVGSIVDYYGGTSRAYAKGLCGRFWIHVRRTDGGEHDEFSTGLLQFQVKRTPTEWTFVIPLWFPLVVLLGYPLWVMVCRPLRRRLGKRESVCSICGRQLRHIGLRSCPQCDRAASQAGALLDTAAMLDGTANRRYEN